MIKNKNVRKRKDILPTASTSYQSSKSSKRNKNSSSILDNKAVAIIEFICIVLLLFAVIYYRSSSIESDNTLQVVFNRYNEEQQKMESQSTELNHLRQKIRAIQQNGDINIDMSDIDLESGMHNKDSDAYNDNDLNWIKDIQNNDYKSLRLQYGDTEAINVLIETDLGNIILELAPIRSMPHTIRYFLTLVENQYWNGCHFFRNAHHVIQANCHKRNNENINGRGEEMISLGQSGSIAFQEYDDSLPYLHKEFSIGLAGRPGGPDFYINLVDNTRNHGPGGQGPKPDPCFARIVSGEEVVNDIHSLEHDGSAMMVLKEWVEFRKVSVLSNN